MDIAPKRSRGRPRLEPDRLQQWSPPEGWVRVVAWVSPEERKALKRIAVEADISVAEMVRALANGLAKGVLDPDEIIHQTRKGLSTMEKIPTIFERDERFKVMPKIKPGCEWVFEGQGKPTEKLDGMNVRLTVRGGLLVRVEKRRNPNPKQKALGIKDGWYVDADEFAPDDKWVYEAARGTDTTKWPDGEHSCEALGPNIQGNPLGLERHLCVPFNMEIPVFDQFPRTYDGVREFLMAAQSRFAPGHLTEGIVFHHPDGRRAKIKRKDFAK